MLRKDVCLHAVRNTCASAVVFACSRGTNAAGSDECQLLPYVPGSSMDTATPLAAVLH
jgi:hypothetical protein